MAQPPAPRVSRRFQLPLVWIVPAVAVAIAGWMIHQEWRDRGPEIRVRFNEGAGLRPNQTQLLYKGVAVGMVTTVRLDDDLHDAVVTVELRKGAAALAREGSQFWIVHPRIGFSGVSGLETIVSGVHLNVRPGLGPPAREFRGLDEPPAPSIHGKGKTFRLLTDQLGTMHPGAPVYYRGFQVGEVDAIRLGPMADVVEIRIRIQPAYTVLVRRNTRFWNAGGVPVQLNLFGAEVDTASLRSFFTGAIGLATPDASEEPAPEGTPFRMYPVPEQEWATWHAEIPIDVPDAAAPAAPGPAIPEVLPESAPTQPDS